VSQLPPLLVIGAAVNVVTLELLLESVTACVTGSTLLACKLKLSEVGLVVKGLEVVELALRTTGTDKNDPADEMLMKPTSVPEVGAPAPIETVRESGVFPPAGLTTNQLWLEKAVTVTLTGPLEEETSSVCGVGVTPVCVLNVSCCGFAASVLFCARAVSNEHSRASSMIPKRDDDFSVVFTAHSKAEPSFSAGKKTRLREKRAIHWPSRKN
jgi:hypothetical protein